MASANLGPPRKGPPIPAGLAARRAAMAPNVKLAPKMNLSQIFPGNTPTLPGGGAAGAGLRLGRPVMDDPNPRRPPTGGTPFANFGKIVYVFFFFHCSFSQHHVSHTLPWKRPIRGITFQWQSRYPCIRSRLFQRIVLFHKHV